MPKEVNTQVQEQISQPGTSASGRPMPPLVFHRAPEPEPKGLIDKLIKRIAV
jgi:hypothetical protein